MLLRLLALCCLLSMAHANVFIITRDNISFVFESADAAFGSMIPPQGLQGQLREAVPYDACTPLDKVDPDYPLPQFALIMRGNCQFDLKVLNAQMAGYSAAIVYNDEDNEELITMSSRHLWDIGIPAMFVTLAAGREMLSLSQQFQTVCFLTPAFDNTAWSIMTASFLSLLALCSVLTLFTYIRRARLREMALRILESQRQPQGLTSAEVKALTTEVVYEEGTEECTSLETCAICLEDYEGEDSLRVLPCKHGFHAACIDQWLTTRSPCCPVCKRDCRGRTEGAGVDGGAGSEGEAGALSSEAGTSPAGGIQRQEDARLPRLLHISIMGVRIPTRFAMMPFFFGASQERTLEDPLLPIVSTPNDSEQVADAGPSGLGESEASGSPQREEAVSGAGEHTSVDLPLRADGSEESSPV